jgi:hypothetical protein
LSSDADHRRTEPGPVAEDANADLVSMIDCARPIAMPTRR